MSGPREKLTAALAAIPYAGTLGVEAELRADGAVVTAIAFRQDLVGNTQLPALHGGLIGAFMELTALLTLRVELNDGRAPRTIGVTVEYLRPGRAKETFARAEIKRLGKRIANLHVQAWQDDPGAPIALLQGRFLVGDPAESD